MSRSHPACRSGRSSLAFVLLVVATAAAAFWFWQRSPGRITKDQGTPQTRDVTQREGAAVLDDNKAAPLDPVDAALPVASRSTEIEVAAAPVAIDEQNPLRGRVVPDVPLPRDEVLEIVVETYTRPTTPDANGVRPEDWESLSVFGDFLQWRELARLKPLPDGRFETPRPLGVTRIRLRASGEYVHSGEFTYELGGDDEPSTERFEIPVQVGAHVTLRLALDGIGTPEETAGLEGDTLAFDSTGPSASRSNFMGQPYRCSGSLDAGGTVTLRGIDAFDWSVSMPGANSEHQDLAPFRIRRGFHFEPAKGSRTVVDVPVLRGVRFEGLVLNGDGDPVPSASIAINARWASGSSSGSSNEYRQSAPDGRFVFQALPTEIERLTIEADGFIALTLGTNEISALSGDPAPHAFTLDAGSALEIRVTDENGQPAKGVTLIATVGGDSENARRVSTDDDGLATFVGLPAGPVRIEGDARLRHEMQDAAKGHNVFVGASRGGFGGSQPVDPAVETLWFVRAELSAQEVEEVTRLELSIRRAPTLRGRVLGARPDWPDPVKLVVQPDSPRTRMRRMMSTFRVSNGKGAFAVDPTSGTFEGQISPGRYIALATSGRRVNGKVTVDTPKVYFSPDIEFEVLQDDLEIELAFEGSVLLEGVVVLTNGEPLPDAPVRLSRFDGNFAMSVGAVESNDAGRFSFGEQPPGTYFLALSHTRFTMVSAVQVVIEPGQPAPSVEIIAQKAGAVRVKMLGADGKTLESAVPRIRTMADRSTWVRPIEDDSDWSSAFGPLAPGDYIVTLALEPPGEPPLLLRETIEIEPGELSDVTLREPDTAAAILTGVVMSGDDGIEGLHVWCSDETGLAALGVTDTEGRYVIHSTFTGSMVIACGPSQRTELDRHDVVVVGGDNAVPTMKVQSGAIEGKVAGLAAISMSQPAVFRAGALSDEKPMRYSGGTSNGHFRIEYLPDGRYDVTLVDGSGKRAKDAPLRTVEIKDGATVRGVKL